MKDHKNRRHRSRRRNNHKINNDNENNNKLSEIFREGPVDVDSSTVEPEYEVKKWYEEVSVQFWKEGNSGR